MTNILFGIVRNCHSFFKDNYLKNEKVFFNFLFLLYNFRQILNIFKKKVVKANVLPNIKTVKDFVKALSKNRRLRTSF